VSARDLLRYSFARTVFVRFFFQNQGLLLAGAVAFYALLSLVPLVGLMLVGLSTVVDVSSLTEVLAAQLDMLVPGGTLRIMAEVDSFIAHREVASGIGLVVVIFFGSQAFSTLERAMAVVFRARRERVRRHIITSLVIPYVYMAALAAGLLVVTTLTTALEWLGDRALTIGAYSFELGGPFAVLIIALRFVAEVVLITSIYLVFPGGRVKVKHALMGGAIAAILWEITRRVLVWYYVNLSMVSVVYGSLATTIVALLTMDAGAIIVLLSAQVIAEYEALDTHPAPPASPPPQGNTDETFTIRLPGDDRP
jgi:YihY family inner membrane protein